jgi:hypothetical protein
MLKVVGGEAVVDEDVDGSSLLDEIAREGARRMLLAALEAEVAAYLEAHAAARDGDGHTLVVRNGKGWFHKLGNVLDKLPQRLQPRVKAALHQVMYAERDQAREGISRFASQYRAKYPKAVTTLEKDANALLTFFDLPAEHWKHLRTSNVIESPFATIRLRQRVTKGAGSRTKGLLMAYKLLDMAQARWRRLDGAHLLPLVRAGIRFIDGVQRTTSERSQPRARAA